MNTNPFKKVVRPVALIGAILAVSATAKATPNSDAGPDLFTSVGASSSVLIGSARVTGDGDGGINTCTWSKASGSPSGTLIFNRTGSNQSGSITFTVPNPPSQTPQSATTTVTLPSLTAGNVWNLQLNCVEGTNGPNDTDNMSITVFADPSGNLPPVVNPGGPYFVLNSSSYTLTGVVTDDNKPTPYQLITTWAPLAGPSTPTISNASNQSTLVTFPTGGVYYLTLTGSDRQKSAVRIATVTVNGAPVVTINPNNVNLPFSQNSTVLQGSVTDDGIPNPTPTITWTQRSGPSTATFNSTTIAQPTVTFPQAGIYVFRLTASDGVRSSFAEVTVTFNSDPALNQPPVADAGPDQSANLTGSSVTLPLGATASDDGQPVPPATLTYQWSKVSSQFTNDSVTFLPNSTTLGASARFTDPGIYVLKLTVSDGLASTVSFSTITINSNPADNSTPDVNISGNTQFVTITGTSPVTITKSGNVDDDAQPVPPLLLTSNWTLLSGPAGVIFSSPTYSRTNSFQSQNSVTDITFSTSGVYVIRLSAFDGARTGVDTATITVHQAPTVYAGADVALFQPTTSYQIPDAVAADDGLPNPVLSITWSRQSGPNAVTFDNTHRTDPTVSFGQPGIYTLRLRVNDGSGDYDDTITIVVNGNPGSNLPPFIDLGPDLTTTLPPAIPSVFLVLNNAKVVDDGNPNPPGKLFYVWSPVSWPAGATVSFLDPTVLKSTVSFSAPGNYVLQLMALDGSLSTTSTMTVTVNSNAASNLQAPTVSAGPDLSFNNPATTALLVGTTSDDGFPIPPATVSVLWSLVSGPNDVVIATPTARQTNVTFPQPGVYVMQLFATDGPGSGAKSAVDFATVTVHSDPALNIAPVVDAGPDGDIVNPVNSYFLNGSASDDGLPLPPATLTIKWSKASGPGAVTFGNDSVAATTATFSAPGVYVLQLVGNDGPDVGSKVSTDTVTVVVHSDPTLNTAPVISAGPDGDLTNPDTQFVLNGTVSDDGLPVPPGATTIKWSKVSGPGNVSFSNDAVAATTATFSAPGVYVVQMFANDGPELGSLTAVDFATVTVHSDPALNAAPVVNAGQDGDIVNPATQFALNGSVSDDGLPIPSGVTTSQWSKISGPGTVTFGDASLPATTATFSAPGVYVLQLLGNDGALIAVDLATVTVHTDPSLNQAPQVNAGPDGDLINPINTYFLDATASDDGLPVPPGKLTLTWSKVSGPGTVVFSDPSVAQATATFSAPGVYVLQLFADDGPDVGSKTAVDFATVTVHSDPALNNAPVVDAGQDGDIVNPTNTYFLAGAASDDGLPVPPATLTVAWSQVSGPGTVTFTNPSVAATSATFSAPGVYVVQLFATDGPGTGEKSSVDFATVTVHSDPALNNAPVISAGADGDIANPVDTYFLNGSATDDGLPLPPAAFTVAWSKVSGPGTVTFTDASVAQTSATFSAPGVYVVRLDATDGPGVGSKSSVDFATVTVHSDPSSNQAPVVDAGQDGDITNPTVQFALNGTATDDGLPVPPGTLTVKWSKVSGPGSVAFGNDASAATTATFGAPGVYVLSLFADDGPDTGSKTSIDYATVTVHSDPSLNNAPVVSAGPDGDIVNPTTQFSLSGTVTDDGLPIPAGVTTSQWSKVSGPGTATFGDATSSSTTVTFSAPGVYVLQLLGDDGAKQTVDLATVTVHSDPALNQAPLVNAGPDGDFSNPTTQFALNGSASDDGLPVPPGAFTVTWSKVSGPGTVAFGDANAAVTTATFGAPGVYVVQLLANDGPDTGSKTSVDFATVTVHSDPANNNAPVVDAGPDGDIVNPTTQFALNGTATDDGLPVPPGVLTVKWSKVSGPGSVTFANDAAAATTATFGAPGVYVLSLFADDGPDTGSKTAIDFATVTVHSDPSLNAAPVVNAGPDGDIVNPTTQFALNGSASDDGLPVPPGAFTVAWSKISGPGTVSFADATSAATTATFGAPGVYVVQLLATDGPGTGSKTSVDFATVTVHSDPSLNAAPVVDAGADGDITLPTNQYALNGSATDDGLPVPPGALTVTWSKVSGPGTVSFANPNAAATTATFGAPGVYVVQLLADDGPDTGSKTSVDFATVTVHSDPSLNNAPVVSAGPDGDIVNPTTQYALAGTASDDGLPVPAGVTTGLWSKVSGPGTVSFVDATSAATTATFGAPGVYVVQLLADDGAKQTVDFATVTVHSDPSLNAAPVVDAGADGDITLPTNQYALNGSASDDGLPVPPGAFTVTWSKVSGPGTVSFANPNAAATTATFGAAGVYVVQLLANDGPDTGSKTSVDYATVTVHSDPSLNNAPVVNAGGDGDITNPTTQFALNGSVSDDGLPVPTGTTTSLWSKVSGPGTVTFGDATSAATTATFGAPGVYVVQLLGDDGAKQSVDFATVTVHSDPSLNAAPVVDAGGDGDITNPTTQFALNGSVTDDGLPIPAGVTTSLWSKISGPGTVTFGDATTPATTATFGAPGVYVVRLLADDGAKQTVDFATVTVHSDPSLNQAPQVNAGPDGDITNPVNTFFLNATASDDGLPNPPAQLVVTWSKISGPGTVTFSDPTVAQTSATFSAPGVYVLQLSGTDSVATTNDTVTVTVHSDPAANQAPLINAGPDGDITNPVTTFFLNGTASDDGLPNPPSTLTVTWSKISGPGTVAFSDPSVAQASATFSAPGVYVLQLSGTDTVATTNDTVTVTVHSDPGANQAPQVNAGTDGTITNPVTTFFLNGTATDDGLPNPPSTLTVTWSKISGPGTVTFSNASVAQASATFSAPGVYVLQLSGTDSVATTNDTVTVTVNSDPASNQAPSVNAGPDGSITNPVTTFFLNSSATDDGLPNPPSTLTVSWSKISGPGTVTFSNASVAQASATFSAPGVYVLQLSANDTVATTNDTVTVTVNSDPSSNQAPQVNAGPDGDITNPVTTFFLNGTATDDGLPNPPATLTVAWSKISGPGTVTFSNASVAQASATFSAPGVYVLQLSGSDTAATTNDTVTVTVHSDPGANQTPVVSAGPDGDITNPVTTFFLNGSATDDGLPNPPATLTVVWSKISGPGTVTFSNASVAQASATFSAPGVYVLQLSATDTAASANDTVTVTVHSNPGSNVAPSVNAGPDGDITNPVTTFFLNGTATDDGLPNPPAQLVVTWSKISGPGTVTFSDPSVAQATATFSAPGVYVLQLSGTDSVATANDTVTVTVHSDPGSNVAPTVNAGPDGDITNPVTTFFLNGSATDDGLPNPPSTLTFSWTKVSGPGTVTFSNASIAQATATFSAPGVYVLQLAANDTVLSANDTVTVTVHSNPGSNVAPQVNAGPDGDITNPVVAYFLAGSATDDGLPNPPSAFTVAWTKVSGPGTVTFLNPSVVQTTVTFSAPGVYVLQLAGNDGALSGADTVTVTVHSNPGSNAAPSVNAGPDLSITNPVTSAFLAGTVSDDGLPTPPAAVTIQWTKVSGPGTVTFSNASVAQATATFSAPGTYVLQLAANDGALSTTDTVQVIVNSNPGSNLAPQVNAGPDGSITLPTNTFFLNAAATDDGLPNPPATLTLSWSQTSGPGTVTFSNASVAKATATFPVAGTYLLQLSASDGTLSSSDSVTVVVNTPNGAPSVNAGPDKTIYLPLNQVSLDATVTDDGQPGPLGYLWTVVSGPGPVSFSAATSEDTSATFTATGTYTLRLTASDTALSGSDDVVVNFRFNSPPVINFSSAPAIEWPNNSGQLGGTATDTDGPNPVAVHWTTVSGPGTVTFQNDSIVASTVTFGAPGEYVLRLIASDGQDSVSKDITVVVASPQGAPPVGAPTASVAGDTAFYPTRGDLIIPVHIDTTGNIRIRVFDILGREAIELTNDVHGPGDHNFNWNGRNDSQSAMAAGIYILYIETPGGHARRKIALLR